MADYFTSLVVHQTIPESDITPLERLLLSNIFEMETSSQGFCFFTGQGPADILWISRRDLETTLAASQGIASGAVRLVQDELVKADIETSEIEIDISVLGWEFLFQDIVRRCPTLDFVSIEGAFTCTKMRSDGFGGVAIVITANQVFCKTTSELLQEFEERACDRSGDASSAMLRGPVT